MCCVQSLNKLYYFLIIFFTGSTLCIENSQVTTERTTSNVSFKVPNSQTNFSAFPTSDNSTTPVNFINSNISKPNKTTSTKKSDNLFTPSIHIGTIEDASGYENSKNHPFNNVQHFELGNSAVGDVTSAEETDDVTGTVPVTNLQSVKEQVNYVYETDSEDPAVHPTVTHHNSQSHPQQTYDESYLTINVPSMPHIYYTNQEQHHHNEQHHPHSQFNHHPHHHYQHPHYQHHGVDPVAEHIVYEKPSKLENIEPVPYYYHNNKYISPSNNEAIKRPEFGVPPDTYQHYYHDNHHHTPEAHNTEMIIGKPETVLYLTTHRETSFMRTRKFPYKHYQPQDDTEIHLVKDEHAFPPQRRQISPWHKIIHIIGAFLPLGLLIAALKPPNVIKIDSNNTDPNIILSKVRGVNLPIEHKGLFDDNEEESCENRSICESILHGTARNVKLIHNILGNFAKRSLKQNEEARTSEFDEIFEAVRKKDCSFIKC